MDGVSELIKSNFIIRSIIILIIGLGLYTVPSIFERYVVQLPAHVIKEIMDAGRFLSFTGYGIFIINIFLYLCSVGDKIFSAIIIAKMPKNAKDYINNHRYRIKKNTDDKHDQTS